jgi:cell division protein FtsB
VSYLGSARGYLSQRGELGRQQAALAELIEERDGLRARQASLRSPAVVIARARELGYVMPGELPLRVTGLDAGPAPPAPAPAGGGFWDWLPDVF